MKKILTIWLLMFCFGLSAQVHVKGYYRKDGTYVRPHTRSSPSRSPSYTKNKRSYNQKTRQSCQYGQCHAIAISTNKRCLHCVSDFGDRFCYQHPLTKSSYLKKSNSWSQFVVLDYDLFYRLNIGEGSGFGLIMETNKYFDMVLLLDYSFKPKVWFNGLSSSADSRDVWLRTYNHSTTFSLGIETLQMKSTSFILAGGLQVGHQRDVYLDYWYYLNSYDGRVYTKRPNSTYASLTSTLGLKYELGSYASLIAGANLYPSINSINNSNLFISLGFTF